MYAITIHDPWATAIARGLKPVENRKWPVPRDVLGRRVAIHVSKSLESWAEWRVFRDLPVPLQPLQDMALASAVPPFGGYIIGTALVIGEVDVDVTKCVSDVWLRSVMAQRRSPWRIPQHLGHVYADAIEFAQPVGPTRGQLGYWHLTGELEQLVVDAEETARRERALRHRFDQEVCGSPGPEAFAAAIEATGGAVRRLGGDGEVR